MSTCMQVDVLTVANRQSIDHSKVDGQNVDLHAGRHFASSLIYIYIYEHTRVYVCMHTY